MTGSIDTNPVLSDLTLSLLEDLGFYQINYEAKIRHIQRENNFGKKQGCSFAKDKCSMWNKYTCSESGQAGCSYDGL